MSCSVPDSEQAAIVAIWHCLARLTRVDLVATPDEGSASGWRGQGQATVSTESSGDRGLRLLEQGHFLPSGTDRPVRFCNRYYWQRNGATLSLLRERPAADAPVHLLDFHADSPATLVCTTPHECGQDRYHARLGLGADGLTLIWRTLGPRKAETLRCDYRA